MKKRPQESKQRKKKKVSVDQGWQLVNPNAAGIDLGAKEHWLAVGPDRAPEPVRRFGIFTDDLEALAQWLKECGVTSVAMEATGVYWVPVFQVLERHGFGVLLVNARQIKNVSGRKSDVADCQWIQRLHSYGLLGGSFRPADACRDAATRALSMESARLEPRRLRHWPVKAGGLSSRSKLLPNLCTFNSEPERTALMPPRFALAPGNVLVYVRPHGLTHAWLGSSVGRAED